MDIDTPRVETKLTSFSANVVILLSTDDNLLFCCALESKILTCMQQKSQLMHLLGTLYWSFLLAPSSLLIGTLHCLLSRLSSLILSMSLFHRFCLLDLSFLLLCTLHRSLLLGISKEQLRPPHPSTKQAV